MGGQYLIGDPNKQPLPPVSAVIICLANPTLAITAALEIAPVISKYQNSAADPAQALPPVYIRFIRNDEITNYISVLKEQKQFSQFNPYTVVEYGGFWNKEFNRRFPEKSCYYRKLCPWKCKKR